MPGRRGKHRMKRDWIKMYEKGPLFRVETVINQPEESRIRRWVRLRKSVTLPFRYQEISGQSNARYLEVLSQAQDPTPAMRDLDGLQARRH
jgi:hypothetical protein